MNTFLRTTLLVVAVALSACATSGGTPYDPAVVQSLHVGTTTQADVVAKMGQPQIKTNNEDGTGGSTWTYAYGTSDQDNRKFIPIVGPSLAKTSTHEQSINLEFDAKGVLKHVDTRETNF
jgi:outer membrane protein assembly factor BamE (lipoprotein component of BamABCDE complex)